jgi:hypothetical protein
MNQVQFFCERDRIYQLYQCGKISAPELTRRLRQLDEAPASECGWVLITLLLVVPAVLIAMAAAK